MKFQIIRKPTPNLLIGISEGLNTNKKLSKAKGIKFPWFLRTIFLEKKGLLKKFKNLEYGKGDRSYMKFILTQKGELIVEHLKSIKKILG